jgi:hypothetical protein
MKSLKFKSPVATVFSYCWYIKSLSWLAVMFVCSVAYVCSGGPWWLLCCSELMSRDIVDLCTKQHVACVYHTCKVSPL